MLNESIKIGDIDEETDTINSKIISILLILIISIGAVGNILNIIVFSKRNMRITSTFRFLLYLSISDLLVLLIGAMDALIRFGFQYELRSSHVLVCKTHTFLTYLLTHASSIILMVLSVDRALVITNKTLKTLFIKRPSEILNSLSQTGLRKPKSSLVSEIYIYEPEPNGTNLSFCSDLKWYLSKLHRVDLVMGCVFLILGLLNLHYFLFINLSLIKEVSEPFYICFPQENTIYFYFLNSIWIWIDISVYSMIPFIIMSVCSIIILFRIRSKSKKYFEKLINKNNQVQKNNFSRRLRRNRQLLYMLLLTNLYFLISMLPYCIMFVIFKGTKSENNFEQPMVHTLLYTNNAINFVFYGFSSQKYRQELYSLFGRKSNDI